MKSSLRNKCSELKVLVIESSVVSNDLLFNIQLRLVKIFGCQGNKPFADLKVKAIGDFFQLSPIRARPVYIHYGDTWKKFEPLDLIPKNVSQQKIEEVLNCNQNNTWWISAIIASLI